MRCRRDSLQLNLLHMQMVKRQVSEAAQPKLTESHGMCAPLVSRPLVRKLDVRNY
jgi:hypothetical protein